jgi:hypothetical protein
MIEISASTLLEFDEDFKLFLKLIDPKKDSKYSQNLHRWLKSKGREFARVYFLGSKRYSTLASYPADIFVGKIYSLDSAVRPGYQLIGAHLNEICIWGSKETDSEYFHMHPQHPQDISLRFWNLYLKRGGKLFYPTLFT